MWTVNRAACIVILICFTALVPRADGNEFLLVTVSNPGKMYRLNLENSNFKQLIPLNNLSNPIAIDYDPVDGRIYWTDNVDKQIQSAFLNGTNYVRLCTWRQAILDGLAVDPLSRLMFYSNDDSDVIGVWTIPTLWHKVLVNTDLDKPRAIVLDTMNGVLFWTDWGSSPRIERANYDGSDRKAIVRTSVFYPNALALDAKKKILYWADTGTREIERSNFDGEQRTRIFRAPDNAHLFGLALHGQHLYYTDWTLGRSETTISYIFRINIDGSSTTPTTVMTASGRLNDVHIQSATNNVPGPNGCGNNNGGCSHICIPTPGNNTKCLCPEEQKLTYDEKSCISELTELDFMLITAPDVGRIYHLDLTQLLYYPIPSEARTHASSIDYDPAQDRMYWTDINGNEIRSAFLNGTDNRLLYGWNTGVNINDIAVDPLSRLIFYTHNNGVIGLVTISSFENAVVVRDLDTPINIVLDTLNGVMYWTESGSSPKIVRAKYDGTDQATIVTSLKFPKALLLDVYEKVLYWADMGTRLVECSDLAGNNRKTLMVSPTFSVFGLALHENQLYFSIWPEAETREGHLYFFNANSSKVHTMMTVPGRLRDFHVHSGKMVISGPNGCGNNNGGCSHICIPTSANRTKCLCPDGRSLSDDKRTCSSASSQQEFMLVTSSMRGNIYQMDMKTFHYKRIPANVRTNPIAIDYDPVDGRIYWTDVTDKEIRSAFLNGTDNRLVRGWAKHSVLDGIALDAQARLLFYSDDGNDVIGLIMIGSLQHKLIINTDLSKPRDIVLDTLNGVMFWTDWGDNPKIERANYDGSGRISIVHTSLKLPNALALDVYENYLYWADAGTHVIERCDVTGKYRTTILRGFVNMHIFGLTLHENHLYFTDWTEDGTQTKVSYVHRMNTDGTNSTSVFTSVGRMNDIHIYSSASPLPGDTPCGDNNGDCTHICIPSSRDNRKCMCPDGLSLEADGRTCSSTSQEEFILLSISRPASLLSLDLKSFTYTPIPTEVHVAPKAIAYDPLESRVYWVEEVQNELCSSFLDGTDVMSVRVFGDQAVLYGIAVDPLSRLIFYTDPGNDLIGLITISTFEHKVLVNKNLDQPSAIVLDTLNGVMFWADWGNKPKIERSNYDGSDRKVIVDTSLVRPAALALDVTENCLYWTDIWTRKIEQSSLTGRYRTTIFEVSTSYFLGFGLAVHGKDLYMSVWPAALEDRDVTYLHSVLVDGMKETLVVTVRGLLDDITAYSEAASPQGPNGCGDNNGGCSHVCFPSPGNTAKCACPSGQLLETNGKTCVSDSNNQDFLIISAQRLNGIYKIDLKTHMYLGNPMASDMYPTAIDYDPVGDRIYWADVSDKEIHSAFLNGTDSKILQEWGKDAWLADIAVDSISQLVFYTDNGNDVISLVTMARSLHKVVVSRDLGQPKAIVLHTANSIMFWSDCGNEPKIERANYDGSDRSTIVYKSLVSPVALALDMHGNFLYWTDEGTGRLERSTLSGQDRSVIYEFSPDMDFSGLALQGNRLYFIERTLDVSGADVSHICRINTDGQEETAIISIADNLNHIHAHSGTLHRQGVHCCGNNNGECSHICIPSSHTCKCLCPDRMSLMPDNKTCIPWNLIEVKDLKSKMTAANIAYGVQFIVVVLTILLKGPVIRAKAPVEHDFLLITAPDGGNIYNIDINKLTYETVHLEIKKYPLRIEYDPVQRRMYWTDPVAREIRSAEINGTDNRLLYGWRKGAKLNGIAVDPLSRLVFYTDSGNDVIGLVTISSFEHKILINSDLDKPADIALDTQNGGCIYFRESKINPLNIQASVMFWTETGNTPRIVRANYDGSSRVTIVDTSIIKPLALMLDMTEKFLYWSDPGRQRIERSSLTGQDRTTVFKPADITYLTGMVVHEEIVYFTDTKNDKDTGNPVGNMYIYYYKSDDLYKYKLLTIKGTPFDIHVYSVKNSIKGPNGCGNDNGGCSHICIPTVNNKTKCMCPDRRSLRADEKTCGSDISVKEFMLVTSSGNGDIYYMDLKTLNYKRIPADVHTSPLAIDYNPQDGHIYWTDLDDEEIRSVSLEGKEGRLLQGWAKHAILNGIAVDSHSGLLFYTDDLNDVIGLVMIESLEHKFVISTNLKNPRAIVLDSENGEIIYSGWVYFGRFIFWSDLGTFPRIERANYDGSGRNTIVQAALQYPNALALDVYEKWLYWADSGTHQIERCDFTGRHRTTIFQGFTSNFFFGLALQTNQLYFIDWTAEGEKTKQSYVHRINTDGTNSTLLFSALGRMNDIHLFSTFSYNTEIRSACDDNNGDCSHICIPISPRNRKCLCPDGGSLKTDGKTCTSNKIQQEFMLLAASNPGDFFSLDLTTFIYKSIPSEVQAQPSAIDYDPLDDRIYWTDVTNKEIRSALLNGSDTRLVRGWGERAVLGDIAVDPLSRLVFYTDNGNDIIGVITVLDFEHKLLIGRDLDKPGAIVLDTLKGVMFWSAWGDKPKIERSNYDGSDRKVIVQTSLLLPLAMVLDITENCLYWTDSRKGRIEKSTLTGQLRTTVFQASSDIFLGLGLAVYDQHLYFTDWTVSKAENKVSYLRYVHTSGSKGAAIKAISGRLNGIHVHSSPAYPRESNGCGDYNGGCSHICFPTSRSSRKCACPDGQSLKANERTCAIDSAKQDFLIVTAQNTGNMYQIDLKTLSLQRMPVAIQMYPTAIDYDPVGDRIYWADVSDKEIRSAFLNGTDNRILREWENRAKVADIAVDPISRLVFYTDDGNDVIGLVTIARSEHRLLVSTDLGKPKAIVLHTLDGIMFWSDCGDEPKIERANYDGSDRSAVVYTSLVSPVALAIDTDGNVLYWTDSGAERLERSNLVGQDRTVIYESLSHKVFSALAFHGRHLYFTEWTMLESGEEVSHVHRINTNGEESSRVFSTSDSLNDIYVHSATLHKKDPQGCGDNNGGCSHICIPSLELISICLCPDGMTLMPDTVTCAFYIHGDEL